VLKGSPPGPHRGMAGGGTPLILSEEAAPGSVTGEQSALLPTCDTHQDKSTERLSGTGYKIEGGNCLRNVGHIMRCRGRASCDCSKLIMGCL